MAFGMFGNPTFWALPIVAATLGANATVVAGIADHRRSPRHQRGAAAPKSREARAQA